METTYNLQCHKDCSSSLSPQQLRNRTFPDLSIMRIFACGALLETYFITAINCCKPDFLVCQVDFLCGNFDLTGQYFSRP